MKKRAIVMAIVLAGAGMTSCSIPLVKSESNNDMCMKYNIDKKKSIKYIENAYNRYKSFKGHKAMAVAMDQGGKYVIGYSYDCASEQSAKRIALTKCEHLNANVEVKPNAKCQIYATENTIVSNLK